MSRDGHQRRCLCPNRRQLTRPGRRIPRQPRRPRSRLPHRGRRGQVRGCRFSTRFRRVSVVTSFRMSGRSRGPRHGARPAGSEAQRSPRRIGSPSPGPRICSRPRTKPRTSFSNDTASPSRGASTPAATSSRSMRISSPTLLSEGGLRSRCSIAWPERAAAPPPRCQSSSGNLEGTAKRVHRQRSIPPNCPHLREASTWSR